MSSGPDSEELNKAMARVKELERNLRAEQESSKGLMASLQEERNLRTKLEQKLEALKLNGGGRPQSPVTSTGRTSAMAGRRSKTSGDGAAEVRSASKETSLNSSGRKPLPQGRLARVLIVDDDVMVRRMLQLKLSKTFDCATAKDGEEGIEKFKLVQPDVILLDIYMPKKDGYQVCEEIRKISEVPIIMLTAMEDLDARLKGLDLGADDFVVKPCYPKEVEARLKAMLRRINGMSGVQTRKLATGGVELPKNVEDESVEETFTKMGTAVKTFRTILSGLHLRGQLTDESLRKDLVDISADAREMLALTPSVS